MRKRAKKLPEVIISSIHYTGEKYFSRVASCVCVLFVNNEKLCLFVSYALIG